MRILLRGLVVGVAGLVAGCATYNVATQIWPSTAPEKGIDMDHVYEVNSAYRDPAGNVLICARGRTAGRSFWLGDTEFALIVSHRFLAGQAGEAARRGYWAPSSYVPPPEDVKSYCPPRLAEDTSFTVLPIKRFTAEDFGSRLLPDMPRDKVRELFQSQPMTPALYVISGKRVESTTVESRVVVYRHDATIARGSPAVEIETGLRKVDPQLGWLLVLPVAIVIDVVTFPLQLLVLLVGH